MTRPAVERVVVVVAVVAAALAGLSACNIFSSALPCGDDDGCPDDEACVDGFCAARATVVDGGEGEGAAGEEGEGDDGAAGEEGEGDDGTEGEGDGAEGDGAEGEGDGAEGEGEGAEGEGDGAEGEGEGDVGAEGEGDVGGEGEGEGPVDPCPPAFANHFTTEFRVATNNAPGATATIVNDDRIDLAAGALAAQGHAGAGGPGGTYAGGVVEVSMNITARGAGNSEAGFQLSALTAQGFDVRVDVFQDRLAVLAFFPDGSFLEGSNSVPFTTGTLNAQLRLDGANPVALVSGVTGGLPFSSTMVLNVESSAVTAHGLDVLAGCELTACGGASATVTRAALYGACRP